MYRACSIAAKLAGGSTRVDDQGNLDAARPGAVPAQVTRRDIEAYVRHRLAVVKAAPVSADFRALQQFWKWMLR